MPLATWNNDPVPINAITTSNELANQGFHELAVLIAQHALSCNPDYETRLALLERCSISGYYCKISNHKQLGKSACEEIATDRTRSWYTKNLARQNSTFYAPSLNEIAPSTVLKEVNFVPKYNYAPMNPSITTHDNNLWMIQRTVNYRIRPDGSYDMRGDNAIRTINYLLRLDDDLNVLSSEEILPPHDLPSPLYDQVIGWEDCRLFFWKNEPWCTATVRELNSEGYCEIVLSRLAPNEDNARRIVDYKVIKPKFCPRQHEKNWMPMVVNDQLFFVYSSDPVRIIDIDGNLVSSKVSHFASDSFRGGGSLVPYAQGWLGLIHESHSMYDNRRRYMHRFVWYDSFGKLAAYSPAFYMHNLGIEFSAGIAKHPTRPQIIISFGIHDQTSWVGIVNEDEIKKMLKHSSEFEKRFWQDNTALAWLSNQTNQALENSDAVMKCKTITETARLPLHRDEPKNWDNTIAIWQTCLTTDPIDPVLDIAATAESAYLPSLNLLGYKKLISINLTQQETEVKDSVTYMHGDCTATNFDNDYFGFISCLSVIEHGVDVKKFLDESKRILKQNGHLFISTDYWQDNVDTRGQHAFGAPVKVFNKEDISQLIAYASSIGLELTSPVSLNCNQRVVNWIGMDYTFLNLMFKKL